MDPTLRLALVAAASAITGGLITGIIAPHIAWGIEKKKQKLAYKRELITRWRDMLGSIIRACNADPNSADYVSRIEEHPSFISLRPQLSSDTYQQLNVLSNEECHKLLIKKVGQIEKRWDLI